MAQATVTITEVDGKWKIQGTTYIDGDENKPWPIDFEVATEEEANMWVEKHGLTVE